MKNKKILLISMLVFIGAILLFAGSAVGKSLYVIADINSGQDTPIQAYLIQGDELVYQAEYLAPYYGGGAVGITLDSESETLFITYEYMNIIQLLDATTFEDLGTTTAPGASNLAGIVKDHDKGLIYTNDRYTPNLYVYDHNPVTHELTLQDQLVLPNCHEAYGIALDEEHDLLYVADTWLDDDVYMGLVHVYETDTWTEVDSYEPCQPPVSVAVDVANQYVYTGNGWAYWGGSTNLLCQYDIDTETLNSVIVDDTNPDIGIIGVAVDQATGLVYCTTGYDGDDLRVYNADLDELFVIGDYITGDPTGLTIPLDDITFNPLHLSKDDGLEPEECVAIGEQFTYTICFDNTGNEYDATNVMVTDVLPCEVDFVSASDEGVYNDGDHSVSWCIGTLVAGAPEQCITVTVEVNGDAIPEEYITNEAIIESDQTLALSQFEETLICEGQEDDTPPVTTKTIGDPQYDGGMWVTTMTPITLTAVDEGVDASGVKEIHYIINGEETIVQGSEVTFYFEEECEHVLEFWAVDNAENEEEHTIQTHYVDDTGPEQTIEFGEPKNEEMYYYQGEWYTGISGHTPIWINSTDIGCDEGGVGSDYLVYEFYWGETFGEWTFQECQTIYDNDDNDINPTVGEITVELYMDESCWHEIHYWCYDLLGNREPVGPDSYHNIDFIVDADAPATEWYYQGPSYIDDQDRTYISCETEKIIHATDSGCIPGGIGVCYMDWWIDKKIGPDEWEIVDSGRVYDNDVGDLCDTVGEIEISVTVGESCEHHIYHQAVDCFGTAGPEFKQYVRVDCNPPETTKEIGDPKCGDGYWVTTSTEITLTAVDYQDDCTVGVYYIYYEIWWDSNHNGTVDTLVDSAYVYDDHVTFTFDEECLHEIRWYAVDMLYNTEEMHYQQHRVDDTPPVTTKTIGEPKCGEGMWVTTDTQITLSAVDHTEPCAVGVTHLHYEIWWDSDDNGVVDDQIVNETIAGDEVTFTFNEECMHEIRWCAIDCLGNMEEMHDQTHYVDDTPPEIYKTVHEPNCEIIPGEEYCVTSTTQICFYAMDAGCNEGVGVTLLEYRTWYDDVWSDWTEVMYPCEGTCITFDEECTHKLEIHAVDCLGNEVSDVEIFHVDNSDPEVDKTVGEPSIYIGGDYDYWVSCETPITIDAYDPGCCGQITYVGYQINDTGWVNITDTYPVTIYMPEDCVHTLDIKVIDCLGHETIDTEHFKVDCTPPESYKFICAEYYAPATQEDIDKFGLEGEEITYFWLTNTSEICINAQDVGIEPCISGLDYIHIELWWDQDGDDVVETPVWEVETNQSQYCFTIEESCLHKIVWYAVDLLGNEEAIHEQYHRLDNEPPETDKTVGEPKWWDDDLGLWWVTSDTEFTLISHDEKVPCDIGVDHLMFNLEHSCDGEVWETVVDWMTIMDNGTYDEDLTPGVIQYSFNLDRECYWRLQWYAVDLFNHYEEVHVQYHKVDNTPPHVIIMKPSDGWYSDGSVIPSVVLAEDLMSPHGECPLMSGCNVGIEDGSQGKAWFIDVFPDFDIIELETPNFLYDADSHEYIGNLRVPEETGIPDGVVLLVVGAEDRLGNDWNSMFEVLHWYFVQALGMPDPFDAFADFIADFVADQNIVWIGMDNTDPMVNFIEPEDGDEIGPHMVDICAEMEDVLSGLESGEPCYVTLNGISIGTLAFNGVTGLCEGTLSIAGLPSWENVPLTITVHDVAGNPGCDTVYVDINNEQVGSIPTVHIASPENGTTHEGMLEVIIEASDLETDPEDLMVNLWVSRQGDPDFVHAATYDDINDYYVVNLDISQYQDGAQLRLQAEATDEDDNTGVSASIIVWIDSMIIYDQWMVEGWNLINLPEICGEDDVASVLYSIDGLYAIVFEVGTWHSYIPDEPLNSLEVITPGNWYWVYMDGASARFYYECVDS